MELDLLIAGFKAFRVPLRKRRPQHPLQGTWSHQVVLPKVAGMPIDRLHGYRTPVEAKYMPVASPARNGRHIAGRGAGTVCGAATSNGWVSQLSEKAGMLQNKVWL